MKNQILLVLRKLKMLPYLEKVAPYLSLIRHSGHNFRFFPFPYPAPLLFECFGKVDFYRFDESGKEAARNLSGLISPLIAPRVIVDAGCGLGRITNRISAHFPEAKLIGCDVNDRMIRFNQAHFPTVTWLVNKPDHPFPIGDSEADFVFSLSVVTHLNEQSISHFFGEVNRILAPGGLFLFTTIGSFYSEKKLVGRELEAFKSGKPVYRGDVANTSRLFTSYHPDSYMEKMIAPYFTLISVYDGEHLQLAGSQKIWIVKPVKETKL